VGSRHERVDGMTVEQRIWKWLRANPGPRRGVEIRAALGGMGSDPCSDALCRLKARGYAKHCGNFVKGQRTYWEAVGTVMPPDMRGQTPGSIKARLKTKRESVRIHYDGPLKQIRRKHFPKTGAPTIALEHAWGFMPVPTFRWSVDGAESENVSGLARDSAPEIPEKAA
jgi:hypothetical protein